ncbi:MAG: alpha/beta hydrolase [Phormidesmis sp.]
MQSWPVQSWSMQPYYSAFQPLCSDHQKQLLPEAVPLWKKPSTHTDTAVICVHGFTGTPYEVAPAVNALPQINVAAFAPLLPGHGYKEPAEQTKAFAKLREDDLLSAARQEIARAKQHYRYVSMMGFSMGGAIALIMAAEGRLERCAVISPALRLAKKAELLIPLLSWLPFTLEAPHAEPFYLPGYSFFHSHALGALWRTGHSAQRQLTKVRCPILGIHSQHDAVIPPVVLPIMQQRIQHPIQTAYFNNSGHVMLLDNSSSEVIDTLLEFFNPER